MVDHPHLTLVDPDAHGDRDEEFLPLPYFPWDERPITLPLTHDEAATAIYLSNGDLDGASFRLKVPFHRLNRLIRSSPRLQAVARECLDEVLAKAASVPIQTLFDPHAGARRLEWASSQVLKSRLASSHPLAPNPAGAQAQSLTVDAARKTFTFRWRTDDDDTA